MHSALLVERYPKVAVEPDAIYIRDGETWTSAGVTTGIDLALALIEQDMGRKKVLATDVGRFNGGNGSRKDRSNT